MVGISIECCWFCSLYPVTSMWILRLRCCRFVRSVGATDTVSARKFLEAAKSSDDKHIFYTVFRFFEQRNVRLRGEAKFPTGRWHASTDLIMLYATHNFVSLYFNLHKANVSPRALGTGSLTFRSCSSSNTKYTSLGKPFYLDAL